MKKILLLVSAISILMCSCGPSRTKKAERIAKMEVTTRLNVPDSYEPLQTFIDSIHASVVLDMDVLRALDEINKLNTEKEYLQNQYDNAIRKLKRARSSAALWSRQYNAYSRENYRQAQDECQEAQQEMSEYTSQIEDTENKIQSQKDFIKQRAEEIDDTQFYGWGILHTYRCKNSYGIARVKNVLIITDENIEYSLFYFSLDESDEYSLQNIKKRIDDIIES